ncbi:hypothetical protein LIA77_10921 [Sarocladium implicatum]|nr:hypothetical protein LIA77_10921 [Sarocladium implicatum]
MLNTTRREYRATICCLTISFQQFEINSVEGGHSSPHRTIQHTHVSAKHGHLPSPCFRLSPIQTLRDDAISCITPTPRTPSLPPGTSPQNPLPELVSWTRRSPIGAQVTTHLPKSALAGEAKSSGLPKGVYDGVKKLVES